MDKIEKTRELLESIGLPKKQQADICVLTILGMANLKKTSGWTDATNEWMRIHDIIQFANKYYDVNYAENSRETFRKQALHHFRMTAIVEDNAKATNSPNYRWRLTMEFVEILRKINISDKPLEDFKENHESLIDIYASKRAIEKMPVKINGKDFTFSTGKHNQLQKAIIEEFATRFAPNSECLYVGDTIQKDLVKREKRLKELGFKITLHDKMPDVVLYPWRQELALFHRGRDFRWSDESETNTGNNVNDQGRHRRQDFRNSFPRFQNIQKILCRISLGN